MAGFDEILKGISDVPIAVLALVFGMILRKRKRAEWPDLFLLIAVSAFSGAAVHMFDFPLTANRIIWVFLYVLLFELIRRFALIMTCCISGTGKDERTPVYAAEALLYCVTVAVMFTLDINDILVFVVFAVLMFARVAACFVRYRPSPVRPKVLMLMLSCPLLLQALAPVLPYAVFAEHVLLVFALCFAFVTANGENGR